jgi:hypothetical protein
VTDTNREEDAADNNGGETPETDKP